MLSIGFLIPQNLKWNVKVRYLHSSWAEIIAKIGNFDVFTDFREHAFSLTFSVITP